MSVLQRISPGTVALLVVLEQSSARAANTVGAHITEAQTDAWGVVIAVLGLVVLHLAGKIKVDDAGDVDARLAELERQLNKNGQSK